MEDRESETQSTYKSRMLRLQILLDELKSHGKMTQDDLLRFGMNRWMMSKMIVQRYIDDLDAAGKIKRTQEGEIIYVELPLTEAH